MKRGLFLTVCGVAFLALTLSACGGNSHTAPKISSSAVDTASMQESIGSQTEKLPERLKITAGGTILYAELYDNETTRSLLELLPLTLTAFDRIGLVKSK